MPLDVTNLRMNVQYQDVLGADKALKRLPGSAGKAERSVKGLTRESQNFGRSGVAAFSSVARVVGTLGGALAAYGIGSAIKNAVASAADLEVQQQRLEGVLDATGLAAGKSAIEIENFADELGNATLTSAEFVRDAAAQLATFKNIGGETFDRVLVSAQDLSSLGFGSLTSATLQLAKALDDPVRGMTALRRSGVSFTKAQEEMVKTLVETNRTLEAQDLILGAVEGQVGGAAVRAADSLKGTYDTLNEEIKEFVDRTGAQIIELTNLRDIIASITGFFERLNYNASPQGALEKFDQRFSEVIQKNNEQLQHIDTEVLPTFREKRAAGAFDAPGDDRKTMSDAEFLKYKYGENSAVVTQYTNRESQLNNRGKLTETIAAAEKLSRLNKIAAEEGLIAQRAAQVEASGSGSGGAGSRAKAASAAKEEASAYAEVIEELRRERDAISQTSSEREAASAIRDAEVDTLSSEAQAIRDIVMEMERLEEAEEGAERAGGYMASSLSDAFDELIFKGGSLRGVLATVAQQLAIMAATKTFGNILDTTGAGNIVGGMVSGLFGMGNIASADGGGYTGNSPRSGGLDGKGGFMALLHPQETVLDHTKGQGMGGASEMTININGATGDEDLMNRVMSGVQVMMRDYDRKILPGRVSRLTRDPHRRA